MADGHFTDVELLRRELATLILEWAGKAVKDDPDGPMSTALTQAVGEAARSALAEQHQILTAETADRIAEALERRAKPGLWRAPWMLALFAAAIAAVALLAFLLGLQVGRSETALPSTSTSAGVNAPIAPLAPAVDEPPPPSATPRATETQPRVRPQRASPTPPKPTARSAPRDLGRPAPANDAPAPSAAQPVGAAPTSPTAPPKP
jgi:hypothetical protein